MASGKAARCSPGGTGSHSRGTARTVNRGPPRPTASSSCRSSAWIRTTTASARAVELGPRELPLGARRPALLRRRGRAVHQRRGRGPGRLLRAGRRWRGRAPGGEQLEDGGWNCEAENGSVRGSFNTTIRVLEGLLAHEQATGGSADARAARRRGEEYLLERRLLRRKSTGEVVVPEFLQFSYPTRWHYDVLRGLDYFRVHR